MTSFANWSADAALFYHVLAPYDGSMHPKSSSGKLRSRSKKNTAQEVIGEVLASPEFRRCHPPQGLSSPHQGSLHQLLSMGNELLDLQRLPLDRVAQQRDSLLRAVGNTHATAHAGASISAGESIDCLSSTAQRHGSAATQDATNDAVAPKDDDHAIIPSKLGAYGWSAGTACWAAYLYN